MIRALVFDFDGLILETEEPDFESWRELYAEHGAELRLDQWLPLIGTTDIQFDLYGELERQLGRPLEREAIRAERRRRYLAMVADRAILPGVELYLSEARRLGLGLAVASSGTREWVRGHLERLGLLARFDTVVCREDVARSKPDPAAYLTAITRLGVAATAAIAFEDSLNGVTAAKRAGLFCVAVPNAITRHLVLDGADVRLESLAVRSLASLIDQATRRADRA